MHTGEYVFVDHHISYNDPSVIRFRNGNILHTESANSAIDTCSLFFQKVFTGIHRHILTYSADLNKPLEGHLKYIKQRNASAETARKQVIDGLSTDFPSLLRELTASCKAEKMTITALAEKTGIAESLLFSSYLSVSDMILMICALRLEPWLSRELLKTAHITLEEGSPEAAIVDFLYAQPIKTIQGILHYYEVQRAKEAEQAV